MPKKLKQISGDEFVKELLKGEKDFSYIKLEKGFNLNSHPRYEELKEFMRHQDCIIEPIIIKGSKFYGIIAEGMSFSHIEGDGNTHLHGYFHMTSFYEAKLRNADLTGSTFLDGCLYGADFTKTKLKGVNMVNTNAELIKLNEADLEGALLEGANFTGGELRRAYVSGARVSGTNFSRADLSYVGGLETTLGLGSAIFEDTLVNEEESEIIKKALSKIKRLIVKKTGRV